jgi:hypothetical protein
VSGSENIVSSGTGHRKNNDFTTTVMDPAIFVPFLAHKLSDIFSVLGFCSLLSLFADYHHAYSHGEYVNVRAELEQRTGELVEKHRETLEKNIRPSRAFYCPLTRGLEPVNSGQEEDLS